MSAAQLPDPTPQPDPPRAATPIPAALNRVLGVLRRLIDYGKNLTATVQRRAAAPGFALFAKSFGTADVTTILTRIINALRRAAALEAALLRRAASGQDLTTTPLRIPAARTPRPARQIAPPDAQPAPQPAAPTEDARLARLPTEQEIAAEVRRRPVGAIIADICRDLGIAPGHLDRAFWDELSHAIIAYGGSLAGYFTSLNKRLFASSPDDLPDRTDPPYHAAPPRLPALATGPP